VVLLPAPFRPSKPAISPRSTLKETFEIAVRPAKCFDRFTTSIMGSGIVPEVGALAHAQIKWLMPPTPQPAF
jgi:hypothetical protein